MMTKKTPSEAQKITLWGRLRSFLFAGILVTAPLGLTAYVSWAMVRFVDNSIIPLIPEAYHPNTYLPFKVPGVGILIVLLILILIGALAAGAVGRYFLHLSERFVGRMPVVRGIYSAFKQMTEAVFNQSSAAFREVVMIEYPRKGIWSLGFITGTTKGEVQKLTEDEVVNVFIPTTPNPTSGFLLFVPKADIHVLEMPVDEGIKMVISAGIVTPKHIGEIENPIPSVHGQDKPVI
ncbi:DUF502 domain-containing protein [Alphaproteobacteria bacterium]|nr:DUF502 domain-containing protein [Alphaproteobacteria bacterium]